MNIMWRTVFYSRIDFSMNLSGRGACESHPPGAQYTPMELSGRQNGPLEQLLASDARAVLLHGPAGAGKTTLALEAYRRCAPPGQIPTAWLLAPNDTTARALQRRLLETAGTGVLLHPHMVTFEELAGRILSAAGGQVRRIGALRRRLLLKRIVRERHAAGELSALTPAVDTPGMVTALQRSISELKRATADPEELTRRVGSHPGPAGDVLKVYRAYQQALNDADACDAEGAAWLARDFLRSSFAQSPDTPPATLGLANLQTLIVEGFTDFTPTQLEILALLQPRLGKLIVTLPLPDEKDDRNRLWLWTRRTGARLREALGPDMREIALTPRENRRGSVPPKTGAEDVAGQSPATLRTPARHIFRYDVASARPAGLEIIAAPGMEAEVRDVARRIKRLLLSGDVGGIAVLARDIEPYRPVIARVLGQMRIPVRSAEKTLSEIPVVRFCLAVVDLARPAAGLQLPFAFGNILRVLRNSYFAPETLGAFDATTVSCAEMILRRGNVLSGRDACREAVQRLVQQADANNDEDDESPALPLTDPAALRTAGDLLEAMFDLSENSQTPAGLLAMLEKLQLPSIARRQDAAERIARDLRAINALQQNIVHLADILDMDSSEDLDVLREALSDVSLPAPRGESRVDVLSVLDARALRWDHVFLLGCDEGAFPRRFTDSALLGEADRRAWHDAGVRLDLRADLTAREMLLFYLAISRAEKHLTVSYRKSDATGRPGAPGGFLQSLIDTFGGFGALRTDGALTSPPIGRFLPPLIDIATANEALAATVVGEFQQGATTPPAISAWTKQNDNPRLARALLGVRTLRKRWKTGTCSVYDGRLSDETLLQELRRTVPAKTIFSAAQLSTYNQCPWRYFAKFLLRLAPLESPRRELEPVRRGRFCHNVLFATLWRLADETGRSVPITRLEPDKLLNFFENAFDDEARKVESRRPVYPALWDIQREQMRTQLREYLLSQQADEPFSPECLHFELSFGREKIPANWTDRNSIPEPVEVKTPAGVIHLCGRIDRVDRVHTAAGEGLFVVDYKTGSAPSPKETIEGRNTQIPLYTLAVESLLGEKTLGGSFHSLRENKPSLFASVKVHRGKVKEEEKYVENREQAMEAIGRAVEGIAAGKFDLLPAKGACDYCEYRRVCHFSPARDELRRAPSGEGSS